MKHGNILTVAVTRFSSPSARLHRIAPRRSGGHVGRPMALRCIAIPLGAVALRDGAAAAGGGRRHYDYRDRAERLPEVCKVRHLARRYRPQRRLGNLDRCDLWEIRDPNPRT